LGVFVRFVASILVCFVVLVGSGCTVWQMETTNRGGYLDYVLDKNWMQADSKRMRALRAFAIEVSLARIASVSNQNQNGRDVLAARIKSTTTQFVPVYMCAIKNIATEIPGTEKDPCFYYDSAMVDYTTGLFDLAMAALPVEDAKNLINAIPASTVSPIAWADLLHALLVIGRDAISLGRVAGALYRDTVELEVQVWLATPAIDPRPSPYNVTAEQVKPLRDIYARGNDDMPAWLGQIAALRNQGLEPYPDLSFFNKLNDLLNYVCGLLTKDTTACQVPSLTTALANQPAVLKLARPAPASAPPAPTPAPPAPKPPNPFATTEPAHIIMREYLHVGASTFDKARAQNLQDLIGKHSEIQAEIVKDQGKRSTWRLNDVVDLVDYASARKMMVEAACHDGLFQQVADDATLAAACKS
jgi:hypothetical protein